MKKVLDAVSPTITSLLEIKKLNYYFMIVVVTRIRCTWPIGILIMDTQALVRYQEN